MPKNVAKSIRSLSEGMRSPTGSVRVIVTAKRETWRTSLFPTKEKTYLLPIKAAVRKKTKIGIGDNVVFTLGQAEMKKRYRPSAMPLLKLK